MKDYKTGERNLKNKASPESQTLHNRFIGQTIQLAIENVKTGKGGPFACIIVKNGKIISTGTNIVTEINDPTAHAEVTAIRNACKKLNSFQLDGCTLYTSCEPCPMCLGAIYWARPDAVYFAGTKADAATAGFDDQFIYDELARDYKKRKIPFIALFSHESRLPFEEWLKSEFRTKY